MSDSLRPHSEARVSPDLIALLRGEMADDSAASPEVAQAHDEAPALTEQPAPSVDPELETPPEFGWISLRCDGRRPLRFRGALVYRHRDQVAVAQDEGVSLPIDREVALYVAEDGGVMAHLISRPAEGLPAWPRYVVAPVDTSADLLKLERDCGPASCLADGHLARSAVDAGPLSLPIRHSGAGLIATQT